MIVTALQILFSLIRYVTETIRSVSVLFSDSEDEPADPNIIYEEPDGSSSSSEKDVSDATLPAITTFAIVIFLFWRVRSGGTKERCFLSVKSRYRPSMLPRSAPRGIEREDLGPEQVGLGYRAVSAVGGDRGRARTVQRRV